MKDFFGALAQLRLGAQVVELGPLNATIHQVNERVRAEDLNKLTRIYQKTIERLLLNDPVQ